MNTATKDLENDHIYILRLTDVMEKITKTDAPDSSDLEAVVYLIRNYADGFHHEKEEKILFPALEGKGFSPRQGPVAVMLSEHVQGRNFVKEMAEYTALYKKNDKLALQNVFINMKGYVDLLRNHIAKENNILFRMADRVLSEEDHKTLLDRYASVAPATVSGGGIPEYISDIERLENKYR